jgi:hypothetical protein
VWFELGVDGDATTGGMRMGLDRTLDEEGIPDLEGPLPGKVKTGDPQDDDQAEMVGRAVDQQGQGLSAEEAAVHVDPT